MSQGTLQSKREKQLNPGQTTTQKEKDFERSDMFWLINMKANNSGLSYL